MLDTLQHRLYFAQNFYKKQAEYFLMTDHDLKYWLALKRVEGVGNLGFIELVDSFGSPEMVFNAATGDLKEVMGIGQKIAVAIKSFSQWKQVEKEMESLRGQQVSIVTYHDTLYPKNLLNIYDYPPLLYVKGELLSDEIIIAVVGSRTASTYGKFSTERLCRELATKGITVASGLARGIDAAAHQGSLAGKGRTIAVLGCGIDIVYPPENRELFKCIPAQGAIITEYPFGTPPNGANFPARNRIISGLSLGVVVVEATDKSGSLITARMALEQGREVFAIPGSIDAVGSKGTNRLIKQGAKLVENADDIIEEILPQIRRRSATAPPAKTDKAAVIADEHVVENPVAPHQEALTHEEAQLLKHLSADPVTIDQLIALIGGKAGEILNTLLLLELKGFISQLPGKQFVHKE
jgi:DNA processing protein